MSRKNRMRAESGTCNVCSAPCSSCMHLNLSLMGSQSEEFSDETCHETTGSQYSINDGNALHSFKGGPCDSLQLTPSEASNLLSVNSNHDSFSVIAESKAILRSSDISNASEDFDMHLKFSSSGAGAEDQIFPKPETALDHRFSLNKYDDPKGAECLDDNISCVSRAIDTNAAIGEHDRSVDIKNLSHSSDSVGSLGPEGLGKAPSSQKLELSEIPLFKKVGPSCGSPNVQSPLSHSQSEKCLVDGSSEALTKVYSKLEADIYKYSGDPCDEGLTCSVEDKQDLKSTRLAEPDVQPLQAASGDETDESDIVEHDVKVCDICGDAGREDLLAICSRCSDGAEHTYCMKEMLQKVPEGDWLCEECKFAEETKKQKQGIDLEGKRTNRPSTSTQSSGKRHAENLDAAPAAKRQVIETSLGSRKSLSHGNTASLSRDSSFKSLDKGKVRSAFFSNNSSNDVVESVRSPSGLLPQTTKGNLIKSSSFSTLNSKAKVKLVDEVVPQRQKGSREEASLDVKEGPTRLMSKSMSFKSASSGRSSAGESKFRALSPRSSHVHDLKGLKQVKEQNAFERKSLSRLDRSLTTSSMATSVPMPNVDQKLTTRGEAVSLSFASNNREAKVVKSEKSEGKGSILAKSNSNLACKSLEVSVGAVCTSAMSSLSVELKPNIVSPKGPSASSSWTAEKPSTKVNETVQDGLPRSVESTNQGDKSSSCRSRPTLTAGSNGALCKKCKETGHDVESFPLSSPQVSVIDVSAGRNSAEDTIKGSKLKAAIEAAMHKLPGTYGRNRVNDQSDGGVANMDLNCERFSQDQFSISNKVKGTHEVSINKQTTVKKGTHELPINKQTSVNHLKPFATHPIDVFPLILGDSISVAPSVAKPSIEDWPGHALADTSALLKISAVPEHKYIWRGGFEVHRGGKLPDLCCGIQAHLSSCASPKVIEMANKFPQIIHLNEVPRVSTWPTMFHESGAKEDNIALYFFAKGYKSYERNYKGLVDSLIKNDLALKGNLNGVELLIFPSNHLPENCQRWNMIFFLWGVFRVRKLSCSNFSKYSCTDGSNTVPLDRVITTDNMSLSQNICLPKHADKGPAACDTSHNIVPGSYGPDKTCITMNGNCDNKVSSLQQISLGSQSNSVRKDGRFDSRFSLRAARTIALLSGEMSHANPSLEECNLSEGGLGAVVGLGTEVKPSPQAVRTSVGSIKGGMTEMNGGASLGEGSLLLKNFPLGNEGGRDEGSVYAEKVPDIMKWSRDKINLEEDLNEGKIDVEKVPGIMQSGRDQINIERDLNEGSVDAEKMPVITKSGRDQVNLERDLNDDAEKMPVMMKSGRYQVNLERGDLNEGCFGAERMQDITKNGRDQINLERDLNKDGVDAEEVPVILKNGREQLNLERDLNGGSVAAEKLPGIMKSDRDLFDLEIDLKDDRYTNTETPFDRNLNFKGVNHQQSDQWNSQHLDLLETAAASYCVTSQKMKWNEAFVDSESISEKVKTGFAGAYECSSSRDGDSRSESFSSRRENLCSTSSNQGRSEEFSDKMVIPKDVGSSESYFVHVDSHCVNDFRLGGNSMPWKELLSEDEDRFLDKVPNLELGLGADTKQKNKGMLPFFVGRIDKNNEDKPPDKETDKGGEGDVSAALSLSLPFPLPDKEQPSVKPASKTEQLLPERRRVNTPLLLFGEFLDK